MKPTTATAIAKAITAKEADVARLGLAPGTYEIDTTVRITGTLIVAEDTEKTPTVSIPVKEVLALFIARSGATREASLKLLGECLTDALAASAKGEGSIAAASGVDDAFKAATERLLASLPKTPVRGAVKAKLEVEEVAAMAAS